MWECVIGMDDQFSIASSDPSLAPFQQRNKDTSNVMTVLNLIPFGRTLIKWKPVGFQTIVNIAFSKLLSARSQMSSWSVLR
jgi:hypothetical protein